MSKKEKKASGTEKAVEVKPTLEEINEAIAELQGEFQATPEDRCAGGQVESANVWRNALARTEESLAAGGHDDGAVRLLRERAKEARAAIARLAHDVSLMPKLQILDDMRIQAEAKRERELKYGKIDIMPVFVNVPVLPATSLRGFEVTEKIPEVCAVIFRKAIADLEPEAKDLAARLDESAALAARLGDLAEPVTPELASAKRANSFALASAIKDYLRRVASIYDAFVEADAMSRLREHNRAVDAEARRIAAKVEADVLAAGASPEIARAAGQDSAEAAEVRAGLVDETFLREAEEGLARILIHRAETMRKLAEAELAKIA